MIADRFRVLFIDDGSCVSSEYLMGEIHNPPNDGHDSHQQLENFVSSADFVVSSCPVIPPDSYQGDSSSGLMSERLEQLDTIRSRVAILKDAGVDAVQLTPGQRSRVTATDTASMMETLNDADIRCFGAGQSLQAAQEPLCIEIPHEVGGGQIRLHGSFRRPGSAMRNSGLFAQEDQVGFAPMSASEIPRLRRDDAPNDVVNDGRKLDTF